MTVSIIVCFYKSNLVVFEKCLEAINNQISTAEIEVIIVNNSISWDLSSIMIRYPKFKFIEQPLVGLTHARVSGINNSEGEVIVFVDTDNILELNYIQCVVNLFKQNKRLGAIGGNSLPVWENTPPYWFNSKLWKSLALRDFSFEDLVFKLDFNNIPEYVPVGAGMALRRVALKSYMDKYGKALTTGDRTGRSLSSGGDSEIVFEVSKSDYLLGFSNKLVLHHFIFKNRLRFGYLFKLQFEASYSWSKLFYSYSKKEIKSISFIKHHLLKVYFLHIIIKKNIFLGILEYRSTLGILKAQYEFKKNTP